MQRASGFGMCLDRGSVGDCETHVVHDLVLIGVHWWEDMSSSFRFFFSGLFFFLVRREVMRGDTRRREDEVGPEEMIEFEEREVSKDVIV
jgi:hypothetical protein